MSARDGMVRSGEPTSSKGGRPAVGQTGREASTARETHRRDAVDDTADRGAVRLAVGVDAVDCAERRHD